MQYIWKGFMETFILLKNSEIKYILQTEQVLHKIKIYIFMYYILKLLLNPHNAAKKHVFRFRS